MWKYCVAFADPLVFTGAVCHVNPNTSIQSRTRHVAVILIAFLTIYQISFGYMLNIILNYEVEAVNYAVLTWALWGFHPRICIIGFFHNSFQFSTLE